MQEFEGLKEKLEAIRVPEELLEMGRSGEIKVKTTEPMEVAFAIHKGSYNNIGETFHKMIPFRLSTSSIMTQWLLRRES